jgi:hypothetical protein
MQTIVLGPRVVSLGGFCPEPLSILRGRLPAALSPILRRRRNGTFYNPEDAADKGRFNFDFESGVRLVITRERWVGRYGDNNYIDFVAMLNPGCELWREITPGPAAVARNIFILHAEHAISTLCPWIHSDSLRFAGFVDTLPHWISFTNPPAECRR